MKGVPLRLEVGPRDLEQGVVTAVRRDTGEKSTIPMGEISRQLPLLLKEIQDNLFQQALAFREENTHFVQNYAEFKTILQEKMGLLQAFWCGDTDCEEKVKEETKATIRCIPPGLEQKEKGVCLFCGKESSQLVYFARAY